MKTWQPRHGHRPYAHLKRDGFSIVIKKLGTSTVKYFTKNFREIDLSFLEPVHKAWIDRVEVGTTAYAELWKPGQPASYISSGLANQDASMLLDIFSVPTLGSVRMFTAFDQVRRWNLTFIPWLSHHKLANDHDQFSTGCMGIWQGEDPRTIRVLSDSEGWVLKHHNADLDPLKIKQEHTCDLVVTGVVPGKGKFKDKMGALICSYYDGHTLSEVANISGFTDDERDVVTYMGNEIIGQVVEVKYQYVGAGGRLRHPVFVRMRPDKAAEDCKGEDLL